MNVGTYRHRVRIHVGPCGVHQGAERMQVSGEFADILEGTEHVFGTVAVPNNREPDGYIRAVCSYVLGYQLRATDLRIYEPVDTVQP